MSAGLGVVLLATSERLAVAVQLDPRCDACVDLGARAFRRIIALGHPESAEIARVGLADLLRYREVDLHRDGHVRVCLALANLGRRAVAGIGRTIERAMVGRARPDDVDDLEVSR